ncbi:MAG TPA: mobile mystery protein A [Terriglobales bacterium]|jgi:predicted DNA-binding mobile mystery protein A
MRSEFKSVRLKQLDLALKPFVAAKGSPRPSRGWIRAIRQATGITARDLAERLKKVPTLVSHLEKSEAEYRITLGSLRAAADALGCQLIYALVPKGGSIQELAEQQARSKVAENVRAVEHTMALEDQAIGGVDEKIEEQTKRVLKRR